MEFVSCNQPNFKPSSEENLKMDDDDDDNTLEDNEMVEDAQQQSSPFYAQQITASEYQKEATYYTKSAVQALVSSPEYLRVYTRCHLCWSSWSDGQFRVDCAECGGHAMSRPCPVCQGKCNASWARDVDLSHSNMEAHWNGECLLPWSEQQGYLAQMMLKNATEDDILDGMKDLAA